MFKLRQIAHKIFVRPLCRTNFFWSGPTFGGSRSWSHNIKCPTIHVAIPSTLPQPRHVLCRTTILYQVVRLNFCPCERTFTHQYGPRVVLLVITNIRYVGAYGKQWESVIPSLGKTMCNAPINSPAKTKNSCIFKAIWGQDSYYRSSWYHHTLLTL